jgi:hypothetical protein
MSTNTEFQSSDAVITSSILQGELTPEFLNNVDRSLTTVHTESDCEVALQNRRMARTISLANHLNSDELKVCYLK